MSLGPKKPRVVIVDDSAVSRGVLAEALTERGIEVVGRAMDGSFGLRLVMELAPDVITCDLEMPQMDGMTFLRIVTAKKPTPVIVVSSDSRPESVLAALELGARDFVVKPAPSAASLSTLGDQLAARIIALAQENRPPHPPVFDATLLSPPALGVVAIGASTGGPSAVRTIISSFEQPPSVPVLIAQHMPPRFTKAYAERLARRTGLDVEEARDGEELGPGMIRVAPGGEHLQVERVGHRIRTHICESGTHLYVPSVDVLLRSVAEVYGSAALAVVLTGMGKDGAQGAERVAGRGGAVWCEDESTAVIPGMPNAAADAAVVAQRAPLDFLADAIRRAVLPQGAPRS